MKNLLLILCFIFIHFPSFANEGKSFDLWKKDFMQKALSSDVSQATLDDYFSDVKFLQKVIDADRKQPEFTLSFGHYMKNAVSDSRVKEARKLLKEHSQLLKKIEAKYKVPATYLVAFWGLETNFGKNKGNIPVLSALATLSFDERRSDFFTKELITMLKIMQREKIKEPNASWAGAFGHFQFMPTTFYAYAVDENNDGVIDVYNDFEDAVGSAANYLSKMGWKSDLRWGRPVLITDKNIGCFLGESHPLSFWNENGVLKLDGTHFNPSEYPILAELVLPEGINGNAFLVYQNFKVIKRWNNSEFYALAIGILSNKIGYIPTLDVNKIKVEAPILAKDVKVLQESLKNKKFYQGKIDGKMGSSTRRAIKEYQKQNKLVPDGFLSKELLEKIIK